jgi:hypothetical protein
LFIIHYSFIIFFVLAQRGGGLSYGKETVFLSQLCITNDRFAKTGSGQTWGKLKNETVFSQDGKKRQLYAPGADPTAAAAAAAGGVDGGDTSDEDSVKTRFVPTVGFPSINKNDRFTQTGSGQTKGQHSKKEGDHFAGR